MLRWHWEHWEKSVAGGQSWKEVARAAAGLVEVWGAWGPRPPCLLTWELASPGSLCAAKITGACRPGLLKVQVTEAPLPKRPRAGPRGCSGSGNLQLAWRVPPLGACCEAPWPPPRTSGLLQVVPQRQAGEGGLDLEPEALQGRVQQAEAGRVGVVLTLRRGRVRSERVHGSPCRWGEGVVLGLASTSWVFLVTAQPQACPLPSFQKCGPR